MEGQAHPEPSFQIRHFPSQNTEIIKKPFLGRFDLSSTLSFGLAAPFSFLKLLKFAPVFIATNFMMVSKAFAMGTTVAASVPSVASAVPPAMII